MKNVIIVGAGVSGLAAGIYAQQSGFNTVIYEKHNMTGGVCTSWSRKGYSFEGAVHWLTDSDKGSAFYKIWQETGILNNNIEMHRSDPYSSLDFNGNIINIYRDIKALKAELIRVSPMDKKAINKLCGDIVSFRKMNMPIMDLKGVKVKKKQKIKFAAMVGMLPGLSKVGKIASQSVDEYLSMFTHEGIKAILSDLMPGGYCALALITTMATFSYNGHFPKGGALGLVQRMTKTYTELGGTLRLSSAVDKILVENNVATGIITKGEKISADAVIVTRDILTADCLFDNPPKDEWLQQIKADTIPQTSTFAGIGINADLSALPYQFHFYTRKPYEVAGIKQTRFAFTNYSGQKEYAKEGRTAITTIFCENTYDWWKKAKEEGRYEVEKEKLSHTIKNILEEKFNYLKDKIEVIDIATPLTYERYTGSCQGSWMSIMPPNSKMKMGQEVGSCKDIQGVYYAGFRTQSPGGLPVALNSGRNAAQMVCRQFNMVFQGNI